MYKLLRKNWIVSYWNLVFQHPSVLTDSFLKWLLSNPLWASAGRFCQCVLKVRVAGTVIFWQENNCLYLMFLTCFCSEKGLELLQLRWTSCQTWHIYIGPHVKSILDPIRLKIWATAPSKERPHVTFFLFSSDGWNLIFLKINSLKQFERCPFLFSLNYFMT